MKFSELFRNLLDYKKLSLSLVIVLTVIIALTQSNRKDNSTSSKISSKAYRITQDAGITIDSDLFKDDVLVNVIGIQLSKFIYLSYKSPNPALVRALYISGQDLNNESYIFQIMIRKTEGKFEYQIMEGGTVTFSTESETYFTDEVLKSFKQLTKINDIDINIINYNSDLSSEQISANLDFDSNSSPENTYGVEVNCPPNVIYNFSKANPCKEIPLTGMATQEP